MMQLTGDRVALRELVIDDWAAVHEGRLRYTMLIRGGWRDSDVYAILEDEWEGGNRGV